MARKARQPQPTPDPFRAPGSSSPLPRVGLDEFLEAQNDPKVKRALREAHDEGVRLKREGRIHD